MVSGTWDDSSTGLEALLNAVRQSGCYHPTEDPGGTQKAFLSRIADSALHIADSPGLPSIHPGQQLGFMQIKHAETFAFTAVALLGTCSNSNHAEQADIAFKVVRNCLYLLIVMSTWIQATIWIDLSFSTKSYYYSYSAIGEHG